ncbi:hypothetical protein VCUG_02610 [Vavraia culicis subsp. floridensis]|uniref:Zinc finger PHD-type domain-containing protein n=1 Tax=Vavraia culicis (isolate floridensis) TaxID=948595 RepID=L2GQL9_VAVCU|nr:uncharacterized protein VCUG_02610 [Vavraia culicis subsp. floridensis]ELA45904.1 hypothetical protein VCUG_02610 [Vavraia culicis subsp. floridensis]
MQEQETLQLQSLKSILLHITAQRKIFPSTNPGPRNRFLCWLNNGIRDALSMNYLHQIVLTVYTEKNRPDVILESYTITVTGKLGEQRPDKDISDVLKMLAPLPSRRYLSMRLVYNEKCPEEYEPEGFKRADYEYVMKGNKILMKEDIQTESRMEINKEGGNEGLENERGEGTSSTIGVWNERGVTNDKALGDFKLRNEDVREKLRLSTIENSASERKNTEGSTETKRIVQVKTEKNVGVCVDESKKVCSSTENKLQSGYSDAMGKELNIGSTGRADVISAAEFCPKVNHTGSRTTSVVNCICRINHSDLDMLQCDKCNAWSHTVCCGFFSNNDKRIPQFYTCNICLDNNISKLALYRRALSVNYNEEILGIRWLGKRLGVREGVAGRLIKKLLNDGFVRTVALNIRHKKYIAVKNENVKKKVKKYFYIGRVKHSLPIKDISMARP